MKKIDFKSINFKNKKFVFYTVLVLIIIVVVLVAGFGLRGKSLKLWNSDKDTMVDIASSKDYSKYENNVTAKFEGDWVLNFSFLHKNDIKVEQGTGSQARWFKLIDASSTNDVTLYFTYEGGRGWSADDYINEVLKIANPNVVVSDVKFAGESEASSTKYVLDEANNTEYYIEAVKNEKGESWLAIVENKKADNDNTKAIAKDLIRSLNTN